MMRTLQIAHKPPYPKLDGGCVAIAAMHNTLASFSEVNLAFITTHKHPFVATEFPVEIQRKIKAHRHLNASPTLFGFIKSFVTRKCYLTSRFYSRSFEKELVKLIDDNKPDFILLESVFLADYINTLKQTGTKILLRTHNVESAIWKSKSNHTSFFKRLLFLHFSRSIHQLEVNACKSVDGIIAISQRELEFIAQHQISTPHILIPMGITETNQYSSYQRSFFHLGAMDWEPNKRGTDWLVDKVWQKVYQTTQSQLHLAGKSLQQTEYNNIEGVYNHGEINNAHAFMCQHGILVVPLFSGSGIRIKIMEAGLHKTPVIATPKAVEGLNLIPETHYLEATTEAEFYTQMTRLVNDIKLQQQLGTSLHAHIIDQFHYTKLNQRLIEFCQSI